MDVWGGGARICNAVPVCIHALRIALKSICFQSDLRIIENKEDPIFNFHNIKFLGFGTHFVNVPCFLCFQCLTDLLATIAARDDWKGELWRWINIFDKSLCVDFGVRFLKNQALENRGC